MKIDPRNNVSWMRKRTIDVDYGPTTMRITPRKAGEEYVMVVVGTVGPGQSLTERDIRDAMRRLLAVTSPGASRTG